MATLKSNIQKAAWVAAVCVGLGTAAWPAAGADLASARQVKALCVLNFVKYVEWPADAFASTNEPVSIGVVGDGEMCRELQMAAAGKMIRGRTIRVQAAAPDGLNDKFHLLFFGAKENKILEEALGPIKTKSILTVGEGPQFLAEGGAIAFMVKASRIRFEIDLTAMERAHLQISSKALGLADAVHGKGPNL
ncbi:MAG TPA: YfiR family protein [Verrucomicrobiae bacterium]|jgi:hypothetical protein|nr:YfiR family protein [Verrucomicrobiae bacterium]